MEKLISFAAERIIQFKCSSPSSGFEDLDDVPTDNIYNTINRAIDLVSKRKIVKSPHKPDTFYLYIHFYEQSWVF